MSTGNNKRKHFSRCFICGNKDGESLITHFRFPTKDKDNRHAWFSFINIAEDDESVDDASLRLCNKHFADGDLTKEDWRYKLRDGAVPTLLSSVSKRLCNRRVCCTLCGVRKGEDADNITSSRFPVDTELRQNWATFCGLPIESVTCNTFLCSRHFQDTDFVVKQWLKEQPRRILKLTAIPSIHLENEIISKTRSSQKRKYCHLCGHCKNDRPYFKFPKNDEQNKKWRDICGLHDGINTNKLVLCGHHFSESDKIVRLKRTDLKNKALPIANIGTFSKSLVKFNQNTSAMSDSVTNTLLNDTLDLEMSKNNYSSTSNVSHSVALQEDNILAAPMNQSAMEYETSSIINDSQISIEEIQIPASPLHNCVATLSYHAEKICTPDPESPDCAQRIADNKMQTPTAPLNCPRRTLRFFGDVHTPDLATPHRARTCWDIARRTIETKNQQIRRMRETITRLRQKIKSFSELIEHLQSEQCLPEI